MASTNGSGGYINERMDQAEAMLRQVAADHVIFQEHHQAFLQEHQLLLRAQVVMQDSLQKQKESIDSLKDAQKATDDRIGILVTMFDDCIRRQSK